MPKYALELLSQDPVGEIFQLFLVFAIDDFVFFFGSVSQLDHRASGEVGHELGLAVGLAFVFFGNFLQGRAFFGLVNGMAFGAVVGFHQGFGSIFVRRSVRGVQEGKRQYSGCTGDGNRGFEHELTPEMKGKTRKQCIKD
ncbi:hypothetical protein [Rhodoferax sp.]|uniref:hypothetical protein n=1 Tax=Rhodoferax sp. TaxID=50421 RepID=UPI003BB5ABFF